MADLSSSSAPPGAVPSPLWQAGVGAAVFLVAVGMAWGALGIPGNAGYGGVGPNFLPWVCAAVLGLCGVLLVREALTGGYRQAQDPGGAPRAAWGSFAWVSSGLLINAALITELGFVLGCALCYALAVQGLRRAGGQAGTLAPRRLALDLAVGLAISAPVFWLFTQLLAINLPGLTQTGWL
jgi:putative tricarboxylic transport membrane protein